MSLEPVVVKVEAEDEPGCAGSLADSSATTCSVKQEFTVESPRAECAGVDAEESVGEVTYWLELEPEQIKTEEVDEAEVQEECGVSSAAARAGLYAGHAVEGELVLGPEQLHAPVYTALKGTSAEPRAASQALHVERDPQSMETGPLITNKQTHTGRKSYTCDICNKRFTQSGNLIRHKRIHSGDKPHSCDICNKQFMDSGNLAKHKRIHSGAKPYTCDICNKQYTEMGTLTNHKRIHTGEKPYACDICNRQFTRSGTLSKHRRIHTKEKPYTCDICHQQFRQSGILINHRRIHTGEKPYACDLCDKQFTRSATLSKHRQIHAEGNP